MGVKERQRIFQVFGRRFLCAVAVAIQRSETPVTALSSLTRSVFAFFALLTRAFFHISPRLSHLKSHTLPPSSAY